LFQEIPIVTSGVFHPNRFSGSTFLIDCYEHRVFLVSVTSNKLLHKAAAPFHRSGVVTAYDSPGAAALS
jgi:hypothetical protein